MLNGNWIFSSLCSLLVGDNSLVEVLWYLTSIPEYLHEDFCGKHVFFFCQLTFPKKNLKDFLNHFFLPHC